MKIRKRDISSESSWIRSDSEDFETRLTGLDYLLGNVAVRRVIYFDQPLDAGSVRQSLEKVLRLYPIVEGRIRHCDGGFCIRTDERGVLFKEATVELPMPEVGFSSRPHDASLFVPDLSAKGIMRGEEPICKIQLTNFQNGAILGVCSSHILVDGSIWNFLLDWAGYTNQKEVETRPIIDRDEYYDLARGDGAHPPAGFPYAELTTMAKLKMGYGLLKGLRENETQYIYFDPASLEALKSLAGGAKLSRFDLLGAMLMKLVANTPAERSELINFYAVYDLRLMPAMSIPEAYMGNALVPVDVEFRLAELRSQSVAETAQHIKNVKDNFTQQSVGENIAFLQRLVRENGLDARGNIKGLMQLGLYKSLCEGGFIYNVWAFPIYDFIVQGNRPVWYDIAESVAVKAVNKVIVLPSPSGGLLVRITTTKRRMRSLLAQLSVEKFQPDPDRIKGLSVTEIDAVSRTDGKTWT
jgi:Transferase family